MVEPSGVPLSRLRSGESGTKSVPNSRRVSAAAATSPPARRSSACGRQSRRARSTKQLPKRARDLRIVRKLLERCEREPRLGEREHRQLNLEAPMPAHRGGLEPVWSLRGNQDHERERVRESQPTRLSGGDLRVSELPLPDSSGRRSTRPSRATCTHRRRLSGRGRARRGPHLRGRAPGRLEGLMSSGWPRRPSSYRALSPGSDPRHRLRRRPSIAVRRRRGGAASSGRHPSS